MSMTLPLLGLGIAIVSVVGMAVWFFSTSSRSDDKRRAEREARRISRQPWDADSADGRGNR